MDDCSEDCKVPFSYSNSHSTIPQTMAANHGNASPLGFGIYPLFTASFASPYKILDNKYKFICKRKGEKLIK